MPLPQIHALWFSLSVQFAMGNGLVTHRKRIHTLYGLIQRFRLLPVRLQLWVYPPCPQCSSLSYPCSLIITKQILHRSSLPFAARA